MAKKKLSRDQRRKQKKQRRKRRQMQKQKAFPGQYKNMVQRLKESGLDDQKFVYNPPGAAKMSEVLLDFLEPYQEYAPTTDAMHKLIVTALVAWNAALLPKAEQEKSLRKFSKSLPADAREDFNAIVKEMIERKDKYFAQYTRHIIDYELTETKDGHHISVISTVDPEEIGE
jgi:hypothetical protein